MKRHLEIDLVFGYARSPTAYASEDIRLANENFSWELDKDVFQTGVLARGRLFKKELPANLYAAVGPRIYLLRTTVHGKSGDAKFGENEQTETRFGVAVAMGGEYTLGPGAILAEVGFGLGDLDGRITGNTSSSTTDLFIGYRLMLLYRFRPLSAANRRHCFTKTVLLKRRRRL